MYSPVATFGVNYPFEVFLRYWSGIASDLNHLWLALVASAVIGLFGAEYVDAWNRIPRFILKRTGIFQRIKMFTMVLLGNTYPSITGESFKTGGFDLPRVNEAKANAQFRTWLIGYRNGAPVKYLDWNGFNLTLSDVTANAFFLLSQLWMIWGVYELFRLGTGALAGLTLSVTAGAFAEWFVVLAFVSSMSWAGFIQHGLWRRQTNIAWLGPYDVWQKLPESEK